MNRTAITINLLITLSGDASAGTLGKEKRIRNNNEMSLICFN